MALKLMYITNDVEVARIAEQCGVDWIFVDLEIIGKEERQGHLDTVISRHRLEDVRALRRVITKSKLLVRVNPLHKSSKDEIRLVIQNGADIVMLPFFRQIAEVEAFIDFVDGNAKTCLLLETPEAVDNIDSILAIEGIDYIHMGLNDLHLGYGMKFMFEPLANGLVEEICRKAISKGIPCGFGGIAQIGQGILPAEYVISEHYRLQSSLAILSRSFCDVAKINDLDLVRLVFAEGIREIRNYEAELAGQNEDFFNANATVVRKTVEQIVNSRS